MMLAIVICCAGLAIGPMRPQEGDSHRRAQAEPAQRKVWLAVSSCSDEADETATVGQTRVPAVVIGAGDEWSSESEEAQREASASELPCTVATASALG